jgi:hypothetical protein
MGIVVTAFYLFGMMGLVILDAALEEPTENTSTPAKPKARPRVARAHAEPRAHKRAA